MNAVLYLGAVVVVLAAIAFAVVPLWRAKSLKGRGVLAGALALFLLGVGGGTYWMLGQPYLAWRTAQGTETRDVNGLIGLLIGVGGALVVAKLAGWPAAIPTWAAPLALGFSMIVGLVFGAYPSWRAARLDPIEALRRE